MSYRLTLLMTVCVAVAVAAPAAANVTFLDDFNGDPAGPQDGGTTFNANNFANWFSRNTNRANDSVDRVASGSYGITCVGGIGYCVDLDGTTNVGGTLVSKRLFNYAVGDLVSLSFQISGNQRNASSDSWFGGFFNQNTAFYGNSAPLSWTTAYGAAPCYPTFVLGAGSTRSALTASSDACPTNGADPFTTYSTTFRAANSGSFRLVFGDSSALPSDNQGAILDNVSLSITAVPEPATWAMLIIGFGFVGSAVRRRRATTALRSS